MRDGAFLQKRVSSASYHQILDSCTRIFTRFCVEYMEKMMEREARRDASSAPQQTFSLETPAALRSPGVVSTRPRVVELTLDRQAICQML
jgi:hypothetical protein